MIYLFYCIFYTFVDRLSPVLNSPHVYYFFNLNPIYPTSSIFLTRFRDTAMIMAAATRTPQVAKTR
jgi:hypothetical protein